MIYAFEDFRLNTDLRELRCAGDIRKVEPQVFNLLELLISNPDRMISKDEVMEKIWDGRIVSEAAVNSRIRLARQAVDDDGKQQRLVKTVHSQGFCFVGQSKALDDDSNAASTPPETKPAPPPPKHSIAVLPFDNMSGDTDQEYFADGLCEDIITALSKISRLTVIARNSTFVYKGKAVDVKKVGQEHGVRYVLEGSVRRNGSRCRITAQLIDALTGAHVWADRYDRDVQEIFELQDEITREIVAALQITLVEGEQARWWVGGTKNFEAWELARKAQGLIDTMSKANALQGRELIDRAISLDPDFAGAHIIRGNSFYLEAYNGGAADPMAVLDQAKCSLEKALELDASEPRATAILARVWMALDDFDRAYELSRKALSLGPENASVITFAAVIACYSEEYDEAELLGKRAMECSPTDREMNLALLGILYLMMDRFEDSIAAATKLADKYPNFLLYQIALAAAHNKLGHLKESQRAVQQILNIDPNFSTTTFFEFKRFRHPETNDKARDLLISAGLPD